jgi:serine/threonine protein kinase, bacterial
VAGQDAAEGTPFGRYRLIELLGRGGMGEVWRAHDTETDRVVAIKLLPANLSEDEDFKRRFRREAHAAARLNSPNVIPIHNYGEIDGRLYVDMRLVEGRDLQTLLADGPLDPTRAVRIIEQVAIALHAAHKVGLLHRDIKPSNILLDENDFAYLIDFGIARTIGETRMTQTGSAIGTFQYIAPERLAIGADEDARADIYSLACVLYEAVTGGPPFPGDTMPQLVAAHLHAPPPRPSASHPLVPAPVDEVIAKGMAKDPNQRYATTIELADAARDAITAPILQPAANPTRIRETQPAPNVVTDQPATVKAGPPAPATPPPPLTPTMAGGMSRRTTIALIAGVFAFVAIAAAVGISALSKHGPSESSPTSSPRSYGAQIELPFAGISRPVDVTVDNSGSIYVINFAKPPRVLKLAVGSSAPTVLPFTFTDREFPTAMAVDSAGDVYVAGSISNRVLELAVGSSAPTELPFTGLNGPTSMATDTKGALYVVDHGNTRVLTLAAGSSTPTELPLAGVKQPFAVAVDGLGNMYFTDLSDTNRVFKLAAGSAVPVELPFTGLKDAYQLAANGSGNVYDANSGNNRVLNLAIGSSSQTVLPFGGLHSPTSVAVDGAGNVFVGDENNARVLKLPVQ